MTVGQSHSHCGIKPETGILGKEKIGQNIAAATQEQHQYNGIEYKVIIGW